MRKGKGDKQMKIPPIKAAQKLINKRFPTCDAALLAGSVVRGEATETSDLRHI